MILLVALAAANVPSLPITFGSLCSLEIVGLCIALAPLVELSGTEGVASQDHLLILRIGDAGFLSASCCCGMSEDFGHWPGVYAGKSMETSGLFWTVAGFLRRLGQSGSLPFHLWLYSCKKALIAL